MVRFQLFSSLALAVMLSACGGSGGEASSPAPPQKPSSVNSTPTSPFAMQLLAPDTLSEAKQYSVSLTFEHASGDVSTVAEIVQSDLPSESIAVQVTNSGLVTIDVSDLQQDGEILLSIVAKDSSGQVQSKELSLNVANTSAVKALEEADVLSATITNVLLAEELLRLGEVLAELGYFNGLLSADDKEVQMNELQTMVDENMATSMAEEFAELQLRARYESRQISETEINEHVEIFLKNIAATLQPLHQRLVGLADDTQLFSKVLDLKDVYIDVSQNRVSSLWGNPSLGTYQQDKWQFNTEMKFIASLIDDSDTPVCSSTS